MLEVLRLIARTARPLGFPGCVTGDDRSRICAELARALMPNGNHDGDRAQRGQERTQIARRPLLPGPTGSTLLVHLRVLSLRLHCFSAWRRAIRVSSGLTRQFPRATDQDNLCQEGSSCDKI